MSGYFSASFIASSNRSNDNILYPEKFSSNQLPNISSKPASNLWLGVIKTWYTSTYFLMRFIIGVWILLLFIFLQEKNIYTYLFYIMKIVKIDIYNFILDKLNKILM